MWQQDTERMTMSSFNSYIYVSVPCFFIFLFCFKNVKFTIMYLRGVTTHFCTLTSHVYVKSGGVRNLLLKMRAKKKTTLNLEGVKHYIITKQKLGFLINLSYLSICLFVFLVKLQIFSFNIFEPKMEIKQIWFPGRLFTNNFVASTSTRSHWNVEKE